MQGGIDDVESRIKRMRLYTLPTSGLVATIVIFLLLFALSVIIGATGPSVWSYQPPLSTTDALSLESTWSATVNVSRLNQRLYLMAIFENRLQSGSYLVQEKTVSFLVSIRGYDRDSENWTTVLDNAVVTRHVRCHEGSRWCGDQYSNNITVIHRPFIDYDSYEFVVSIVNASIERQFFPTVVYRFSEVNANFSLFTLWFRAVFLLFTFIAIAIFAISMRKYEWRDWTLEQKWTIVVLFGLMGYNNPFYPLIILTSGWFASLLDQLLLVTFLVLLLLFWLVMFDGIRTEASLQTFKRFYLPKLILLLIFWLLAAIVFSWDVYACPGPQPL